MLAFLGDIHGDMGTLRAAHNRAVRAGATALIQVGDFGFNPSTLEQLASPRFAFTIPVYVIDGNHEHHSLLLLDAMCPVPLPTNSQVIYMPRGSVLELDGKRVLFLGGAASIDKEWRLRNGWHWSPLEEITPTQRDRAAAVGPVDVMVSHAPPTWFVEQYFETPRGKLRKAQMFGVSEDWSDPSTTYVEEVWNAVGQPTLFCGHMHETISDGNVHLLNIDELRFH